MTRAALPQTARDFAGRDQRLNKTPYNVASPGPVGEDAHLGFRIEQLL